MNSLFASTARGLEELLKSELERLGAHDCQIVPGGVRYQGDALLMAPRGAHIACSGRYRCLLRR